MKVIITGGRDYKNKDQVRKVLKFFSPDTVVVGDCPTGADFYAQEWAKDEWNWTVLKEYKADWDNLGKKAGPIRNKKMVDENRNADVVIAFKGGDGTENTVSHAKKAGMLVLRVD